MKLLLPLIFTALATAHLFGQASDMKSGRVVDEQGSGVPGARIVCAKNSLAVTSGPDGQFSISCRSELIISASGFATLTRAAGVEPFVLHPLPVTATVNVTRVASTLSNTPASVAVVNHSDLENSPSLTLDDRLRQVPGFTLFRRAGSSTANPTTQGVSLRGVGASGASRALVLNDGVPLNDPFGSWVYWGRIPAESISEVEMVRGPASDLYGSSAIGGVISILGRGYASGSFANLDLAYGSQRSPYGSLFGGVGTTRVRTSLGAEAYRTEGFIPTATEARGPIDTAANVSRYAFRPRFDYQPASGVHSFAGVGLYQERRRNGSPQQNNDTRIVDAVLGFDAATKHAGSWSGRLYGLTEKYHQSFSAITPNRQTESLNRLQTVPSQALGSSVQWTGNIRRHVVFAGADLRQIRGRSDETAVANGLTTSLSSAGGRETTFGGFAGLVLDLKRVSLGAALRYDSWWNTRGYTVTRPPIGAPSSQNFEDRSEHRFSPRLSILARLTAHLTLTGLYSTAFRQPTLNELYRNFRVGNVLTLANAELAAERATSFEAAMIVNALDQRLYLRAGPYCTHIANTISNATLSTTPSLITRQRQNLGSTRSCGLEADFKYDPSAALSFSAGYVFVDPVVSAMPGNSGLVGLQLPQTARDQFTANLRYSPAKIGAFSAQFRTSSAQWDDDLNTLRLAAYSTVDLFASRDLTRRASVYVAVENVMNSRIESGRTPVLTLARPRSFRVGIKLRSSSR